jgi:hypothetical protein
LGHLGIAEGLGLRLEIEAKVSLLALSMNRRDDMATGLKGLQRHGDTGKVRRSPLSCPRLWLGFRKAPNA